MVVESTYAEDAAHLLKLLGRTLFAGLDGRVGAQRASPANRIAMSRAKAFR